MNHTIAPGAHEAALAAAEHMLGDEMADRIYTQRIQEHRRAGERSGVHATPSFFLNGTLVDVSFGFEKLNEAIHAALDAAPHGPRSTRD